MFYMKKPFSTMYDVRVHWKTVGKNMKRAICLHRDNLFYFYLKSELNFFFRINILFDPNVSFHSYAKQINQNQTFFYLQMLQNGIFFLTTLYYLCHGY